MHAERQDERRLSPSVFQYDYLVLDRLMRDISRLLHAADLPPAGLAVDVGASMCPYRTLLTGRGLVVKTLDIDDRHGADLVGTAVATGLEHESVDMVICTQVLEHVEDPSAALTEFRRVLKPGAALILSVPHVWFYHPHPNDYWRFTSEGVRSLCRRNGFAVKALMPQGGSVLTTAQVINFSAFGLLGRWGAPMYAAVNLLTNLIDPHIKNDVFPINFACLAYREAG
jgi:SAM-dependent methyltransferase